MEKYIQDLILSADAKALATYSNNNLNVVPVSSIKIVDGKIWLIDYFMDKTLANILNNKSVAFVCWRKMMGYQIKGVVSYTTSGQDFDEAVKWIKSILPDRVVKGLIILTPNEIHDISPTKDTKEKVSSEQNL
ncbi:MAG: pyridoxamine 5'-phosphate oxidase family protein [Candidatus Pacebacteria bacterium]|jgi:predicted pyridoxine 5'-phosphate oxidase superfamily flavin-nucleotide-binding protein|nr:pyridoxamine 5'-phosphate oxidase family protein [Candidatus Paceibacterota bacterium]